MSRLIIKSALGLEVLVTQDTFNGIMDAQANRTGPYTFKGVTLSTNETNNFIADSSTYWRFLNYETMAQPIQVEPPAKAEEPSFSFTVNALTKLSIEPGEALVVSVDREMPVEEMKRLKESLAELLGTSKIVVINGEVDFYTLKVSSEVPHVEPKLVDTNMEVEGGTCVLGND